MSLTISQILNEFGKFDKAFWISYSIDFNTGEYQFVFKWIAFLLPLHALNVYLNSILKGIEQFKKVIKINILTHVLNVLLFSFCIYLYGLNGALMAVVVVPSASFVLQNIFNFGHILISETFQSSIYQILVNTR